MRAPVRPIIVLCRERWRARTRRIALRESLHRLPPAGNSLARQEAWCATGHRWLPGGSLAKSWQPQLGCRRGGSDRPPPEFPSLPPAGAGKSVSHKRIFHLLRAIYHDPVAPISTGAGSNPLTHLGPSSKRAMVPASGRPQPAGVFPPSSPQQQHLFEAGHQAPAGMPGPGRGDLSAYEQSLQGRWLMSDSVRPARFPQPPFRRSWSAGGCGCTNLALLGSRDTHHRTQPRCSTDPILGRKSASFDRHPLSDPMTQDHLEDRLADGSQPGRGQPDAPETPPGDPLLAPSAGRRTRMLAFASNDYLGLAAHRR